MPVARFYMSQATITPFFNFTLRFENLFFCFYQELSARPRVKGTYLQYKFAILLATLKHSYLNHCLLSFSMLMTGFRYLC